MCFFWLLCWCLEDWRIFNFLDSFEEGMEMLFLYCFILEVLEVLCKCFYVLKVLFWMFLWFCCGEWIFKVLYVIVLVFWFFVMLLMFLGCVVRVSFGGGENVCGRVLCLKRVWKVIWFCLVIFFCCFLLIDFVFGNWEELFLGFLYVFLFL